DSCLSLASPCKSPRRCFLATAAVSANTNSPQPQLLTILCLMRYEDWTFREAEVRLAEHRELSQALGLTSVPDFTTLYRFLQRLDDQTIDQAVGETVRRLRGARKKGHRRARVGVDGDWRKERSARSLCGACTITGKSRCRGGMAEVGDRGGFGSA